MAWWPEAWHLPFFAVVEDIRTGSRRMYLPPGQLEGEKGNVDDRTRKRGWKTALGEVLFVMGQEEAGICVWHLERDEMKRVGLPGAFERCVVDGERLLLVGRRNGEVWLWDWESAGGETGRVATLDVARMGCYTAGPVRMGGQGVLGYPPNPRPPPKIGLRLQDSDEKLDFILHPTRRDVFFVLKWDEVDLVAYEITSGLLTATVVCPRGNLAHRIMQLSLTEDAVHYLRSERCDARGGYCLMTAYIANRICDPPCQCDWGGELGLGSVCFNVYTKTFSAFVHHTICVGTPDAHLWDGLLAVPIAGQQQQQQQQGHHVNTPEWSSSIKRIVAMLEPCDGGQRDATTCLHLGDRFSVRTITHCPVDLTFPGLDAIHVGVGERVLSLHGMAYALEAGDEQSGLNDPKPEWLGGDERTLIYAGGKEYTVWMFGEDPRYPEQEPKKVRPWRDGLRTVKASFKKITTIA